MKESVITTTETIVGAIIEINAKTDIKTTEVEIMIAEETTTDIGTMNAAGAEMIN